MELFDRRAAKEAAGHSLSNASGDPKRLVLIHTGAALLLAIALTVIDYLLEQKIGTTGGLSGIGTRSILTTAQSILRYVQILVLPIWNCGYLFACLQISRQKRTAGCQPDPDGHAAGGLRSAVLYAVFRCGTLPPS